MKLVLINPQPKIWIKSTTLPLGLAYIAAYALSKNYEVSIADLNLDPQQTIPKADIYGLTATTPLIGSAYRLAAELKKSGAYTVLGGPHPTCLPDEALSQPCVDFVIRGEGEISFFELVQSLEKQRALSDIPGLSFKENGKITHNELRPFIKDLDELPFPAYELFGDLKRYSHPQPLIGWRKPVVNIITSRGCPFNCHFCYKGTFGRTWRARSPQNIIAEWEMLINRFHVKELSIQDDCFNMNIERAIQISELISQKGLQIPWSLPNGLRADMVTEELIGVMKQAGMYRTGVGVESGNQLVMDDLGKKLTLEKVEEAFRILKKFKIQTVAFFVMGNPKDTETTLQETIDFAIKLSPTFAQFTMATPFPGTRLYQTIKALDSFRITNWDDYSQFDQKGFFDYDHISGTTIMSYVKKGYRSFYLRISQILRIITLKDFYYRIPAYFQSMLHFLIKGK